MPGQLSPDRAVEASRHFHGAFTDGDIDAAKLHRWVHEDPNRAADRLAFLAGTAWGQIRWDKALGHPDSLQRHAAFVVVHSAYVAEIDSGPAGEVKTYQWVSQADVILFDAPDDGDDHVVGFWCRSVPAASNKVNITFAVGPRWISVNQSLPGEPLAPSIQPDEVSWVPSEDPDPFFLEPVRVT
jgi:hypothetical protein